MYLLFEYLFVTLALFQISASTNDLLVPQKSSEIISSEKSENVLEDRIQVLRISTAHFEPFMYQDKNGNFIDGIEYKLVKMIAKQLNLKLSFQSTLKHSDICINVARNLSDICLGNIFPNVSLLQHTEISVTYGSDDLTWCVRRAGIMSFIISQFKIAKPETWIVIFLVYGYGSGLILYLLIQFDMKYKNRNNIDWHYTTLLISLPACVNVSPGFQPTGSIVRGFYGFMLIACFIYFQIFFSRLHEFLFKQTLLHQISSLDEIIENDFHLVGSQEASSIWQEVSDRKIEFHQICENISECIDHVLRNENVAFGGSRQNILNSPYYSPSTIFCFDRLYNSTSYPLALYMKRGFNFREKINDIIHQLLEAGQFEKWNDESRLTKRDIPYSQSQFLLKNIAITVVVVVCGFIVSTLTFIVETITFWKMKQEDKHKIWIYFEQFVDGKRHYLKHVPERLLEQNKNNIPENIFPYLE